MGKDKYVICERVRDDSVVGTVRDALTGPTYIERGTIEKKK
jgi:hypothetical protein